MKAKANWLRRKVRPPRLPDMPERSSILPRGRGFPAAIPPVYDSGISTWCTRGRAGFIIFVSVECFPRRRCGGWSLYVM
ncbi:hypothetical protein ACFX13_041830 [Malus domestica]